MLRVKGSLNGGEGLGVWVFVCLLASNIPKFALRAYVTLRKLGKLLPWPRISVVSKIYQNLSTVIIIFTTIFIIFHMFVIVVIYSKYFLIFFFCPSNYPFGCRVSTLVISNWNEWNWIELWCWVNIHTYLTFLFFFCHSHRKRATFV